MRLKRREFLKAGAAGFATLGMKGLSLAARQQFRSTAAIVKNEQAIDNRDNADKTQCRAMIKSALKILTGKSMEAESWKALGLVPADIVAIKLNMNNHYFPLKTHPELTYAVCDSLCTVIPANNIVIYERYSWELTDGGYTPNNSATGVRVIGAEQGNGFDSTSSITKIVSDMATKVIHMPTLKYIGGEFQAVLFLKDHIGSIPPSDMPSCHGNPMMATQVLAQPPIKNKNLLNICDGLRGTCGTPWFWKGIVASTDPIAAEAVCLNILDEKRKLEGMGSTVIKDFVKAADTSYGLGTSELGQIQVIEEELPAIEKRKKQKAKRMGGLQYRHFPNPSPGPVRISLTVPDNNRLPLNIFNGRGQCIRRLDIPAYAPGSSISVLWDGRDFEGRPMGTGNYYYTLASAAGQILFLK
jgi:uncharacterized protein (DUF362 family)